MNTSYLYFVLIIGLGILTGSGVARAELRWGDLNTTRPVLEVDWLRLKLEVLALRLSYPAYRVEITLSDEAQIQFNFVASGGMAKHLTEETGRGEAEEVITYHARGLRDQVEKLLKEDFPALWTSFDGKADLTGRFLGPGEEWSDPPHLIGTWLRDEFSWAP